jgi:tetratricopeptide (TPR) repeat protein
MGMGAGVQAQDDERALGAATDTICRIWGVTKKPYVYRIVEKVFEDHPTASFATRIAKAFYSYNENNETHVRDFHISDTVAAFRYIRRSIELDPKYAEAYVVASDILSYDRKDDEAMRWLDEGLKHNPKDSSLYLAQANLLVFKDESAAVAKLEELRKLDPAFPVDLALARIYGKLDDRGGSSQERAAFCEKMVSYYGKVNMNDMTAGDLGAYAFAISVTLQDHNELRDKWYEISTFGVKKYPEDLAMRKYLLYACRSCEKWDEGIVAGNTYFSMMDSTKIQALDYIHYGTCLRGVKRYDEAIAQYEKAINLEDCSAFWKSQAESLIATAISNQVDEVRKSGDFQKAVDIIKPYVEKYKAMGKQNDNLMVTYGFIYVTWSSELKDEEKKNSLLTAVKIYEEASEKSALNKYSFLRQCTLYCLYADPEMKDGGLGLRFAQKLVDDLSVKSDLDSGDKRSLIQGYDYLMRYELFAHTNKKGAIEWAEKILDIDPSNQAALQYITALGG